MSRRLLIPLFAVALAWGASAAGALAPETAPAAAHKIFQWRPFLAPFHSVVLHFPIGFLTMAGILEVYRAFRPGEDLRRLTVLVLWLGLLTGGLSALFGILRAGNGEYEANAVTLHRGYGFAVVAINVACLFLIRLGGRPGSPRFWTRAYHVALAGTLVLVVVAGHYGGNLTHGSKYLVENAPEFVRELLEDEPAAAMSPDPGSLDTRQREYVEKVQPVLERRCYSCHGPDKQKGGWRVDQPEVALRGGDSGKPAIKPGDPIGSHLVQLILLPPQHDDIMPPEGKQPLTPEETMTLIDWIRNGAAFPPTPGATNPVAPAGR